MFKFFKYRDFMCNTSQENNLVHQMYLNNPSMNNKFEQKYVTHQILEFQFNNGWGLRLMVR